MTGGLWISKNITELIGGRIKIESELGNGSNFMIALPLISGEEANALKDEEIDSKYQTNEHKGKRILYVEDISENQIVMKQLLIQLGFNVEIACDGAEGLHLFKSKYSHYYDLVLTDLRMPNMSGQTMIMQIRQTEQLYIYIYIYIYNYLVWVE